MAERTPGFDDANTPERAGGIVRDHVRAVIESAEGNAAEIRRRARDDADALDTERADAASRLTTQIGELEGSFTTFGEQLGKEVLPSGEIKGELGSSSSSEATSVSSAAPGAATAWRSPEPTAPSEESPGGPEQEEAEGKGVLGGLRKRFGGQDDVPDDDVPEAEVPDDEPAVAEPAEAGDTAGSSDWVPPGEAVPEPDVTEPAEEPEPSEGSAAWAPASPPEETGPPEDQEEQELDAESTSSLEDADYDAGDAGTPDTDEADPGTTPSEPTKPPRGRIARLLLGRRPGE